MVVVPICIVFRRFHHCVRNMLGFLFAFLLLRWWYECPAHAGLSMAALPCSREHLCLAAGSGYSFIKWGLIMGHVGYTILVMK